MDLSDEFSNNEMDAKNYATLQNKDNFKGISASQVNPTTFSSSTKYQRPTSMTRAETGDLIQQAKIAST